MMFPRGALAADVLRLGQARFPGIRIDASRFGAFIGKLPTDDDRVRAHAEDLFLAFACAAGAEGGAEALEETHLVHVPSYVRRYGTSREFLDELMQRLRWKLLLDQPPKIATYSGTGPLGAWIRIAAVRLAIDRISAHDDARTDDTEDALVTLVEKADPELETLRRRYGPALQEALRAGLEALSPQDRTLLWLHYGQQLSVERLGGIHGVHRATVARWLSALQQRLLDDVRSRFAQKWQVSPSEFGSLCRVMEQDLRISLRLLRTALADDEVRVGIDAAKHDAAEPEHARA